MASGTILKTTLQSQAYENIYNFVNNRSNIPDPRGGNRSDFVRKVHALPKGSGKGFPYIVVFPPTFDQSTINLKGTKNWISYSQSIEVRTSNAADKEKAQDDQDSIIDSLLTAFNKYSNKQTFNSYKMRNLNINVITQDFMIEGAAAIFATDLELTYDLPLDVT